MESKETNAFEGWAILELMGHRRLGGKVSEETIAGQPFVRIDVPGVVGGTFSTQFYSGPSIYCLTPTTEAMARAVAQHNQPQPVQRWELPKLAASGEAIDGRPATIEATPEWDEDDEP